MAFKHLLFQDVHLQRNRKSLKVLKASGRVCSLSNLSLFCHMDMLEADTCYFFFQKQMQEFGKEHR